MRWIPFVMVRLTAVFAIGVLTGIHFPGIPEPSALTVSLIILCLVYLMLWFVLQRSRVIRMVSGLIAITFLFLTGVFVVSVRDESLRPEALSQVSDSVAAFRVRILSPAERREKSWRLTGEIVATQTAREWRPSSGKLLLYWPLAENVDTLHYGDELLVKGSPQLVQGPRNPGEFDYRAYLARRNIFHQQYVRPGAWRPYAEATIKGPLYYATEARRWTLRIIDRVVQGEREQSIMAAFVIGVTEGIDDELKQAYAAGGAMHALAVSGMHVSILYGVLIFLLKPMERRRGGHWTIALVSLLVLWMYGFVTGLTPSVLRAVTMFSFVALARPFRRTTSILNTLAASAFFLLLFDPWLILSAGFQLSYLAVLGIVLLYRPIYNLLELPWAWADWIWQITCVSIAAQLATLPVTLYYFHQFPLYFLLANLFVIPASTLILLGGMLLLLVSPVPLVAGWLARILEGLIRLLNDGLFTIGGLPASVIQPIPLSLVQSLCLGFMLVCFYGLFRSRRFHWVWVLTLAAVVFSTEDWRRRVNSTERFMVHDVAGHTSLEWQRGGHAFWALDSALATNEGMIEYHIAPFRLQQRIRNVERQLTGRQQNPQFFLFRGLHFLRVSAPDFHPEKALATDYLIIGNNGVTSLESLRRSLTFDWVILDGTNTRSYARRLRMEAHRLNLKCWSVVEQGAFVRRLK